MDLPQRFRTTRWTLIASARDPSSRAAALEALCTLYWYPLYAFVRRAYPKLDAADVTQGFFADIIARDDIAAVDAARGRFRSWLLQSMRNFANNVIDGNNAQKRGGGVFFESIDWARASQRYDLEPKDVVDAEKLYARRFALETVKSALVAVRAEYAGADVEKQRLFDAICGALVGDGAAGGFADVAKKHRTTQGALRVLTHRLRHRLRQRVADTLDVNADVDHEIEELIASLS